MLWRLQRGTIRDVHDELIKNRKLALTGVATMMQNMLKKGILKVVDQRRPQKFAPAVDSADTKDAILKHLAMSLFNGSARNLVMHLFRRKHSPERNAQLQKFLKDLE